MSQKKFLIIDANSLIHRAFHALPPLTTKDGQLVNAVYGFATILLKALKEFKPDYMACCFDVSKETFRKKEYQEYKAKRAEQPLELYEQIDLIKQLLEAFRIPVYEKEGYEADDVIGTIVNLCHLKNIIVSGDLDTLQLVDEKTEVYTLKHGISETMIYGERAVEERYGFEPEKLIDYKALRGDPSDNIPGVKGVGEKTAGDLIKKYGSLDGVYKEIKDIKGYKDIKESVVKKLKEHKREAYLSKKLATIVRDVKINFDLKDCQVKPFDTEQVVKLFQAWNFTSLISKIPQAEKIMYEKQGMLFEKQEYKNTRIQEKGKKNVTPTFRSDIKLKKGYHLINDQKSFDEFLKELKQQKEFAFDTETDGLNPFKDNLIGMSFSWKSGEGWYLPIISSKQRDPSPALREGRGQDDIVKILENPEIKKIGHNIKFDLEVLDKVGIKLQGLAFDTMIASYLLNPGTRQHNLETLAFTELGYKMQSIEELSGQKKKVQIDLSKIDVWRVTNYACEDVDITWQLYHKLSEKLDDVLIEGILEKIEMPLITVLAEMEKVGVKLDIRFLNKMSKELESRIKNLELRIHKMAGVKFNVASPIQLKEILFEKLKISTIGLGKTKTGISTAAGELEKLKGRHRIIDLITEHRELSKLKNTYLDPLPQLVDGNDRVHTSFNQTVTATGRLSSSEPNLQNIPIRTELGQEIRKAFVAERGYRILSADYSQIELRIVASLSGDEKMLAAFQKGEDVHTRTAAEIFEITPDKVTKEMRRQAKVVNFGIIYGLGAHGLAASANISYEQAQDFIDKYFTIHSGIREYIENTIALAKEMGYVETLFGRRRYLPEINAQHQQLRAQAERMAINHPVQGCLQFDTRVLTSGGYKRIGELYENKKLRPKYVWNGSKWCEYEVLNRGKAQLAQIEFENGQILNCDTRHEILVVDDYGYHWVHYRNFKKGMKACFSVPQFFNFKEKPNFSFDFKARVHNSKDLKINRLTPEFWYWIGYYYGDGYFSKRKDQNRYRYTVGYYFGKKNKSKARECINFFNSLGLNAYSREFGGPSKLSTRIEVTISSHGLGKLFEVIGVKGFVTAHTKRLPDLVFSENSENRRKFIEGLMDSDGCYGGNDYVPNIHLCQRDLLADVQVLFRTLRVDSKLRGPYKHEDVLSFRLDIPRRALFKVLNKKEQDFIGTHYNHKYIPQFIIKELLTKYPNLTRKGLKTDSDYILYNRWKNGGNSSIYHFVDWLERNNLKLNSPVYLWHKIKKIKNLKKRETTYTLGVKDGNHRFDSEGVISKNTAADLMKLAMINLAKKIKKEFVKDEVRMLLQVHDELVFEIKDDLVNYAKKIIEYEMTSVYKLRAPIEVEIGEGRSWGECK